MKKSRLKKKIFHKNSERLDEQSSQTILKKLEDYLKISDARYLCLEKKIDTLSYSNSHCRIQTRIKSNNSNKEKKVLQHLLYTQEQLEKSISSHVESISYLHQCQQIAEDYYEVLQQLLSLQDKYELLHKQIKSKSEIEERIKKHLSYRIGKIIVINAKNFFGWLKIPLLIWQEYRLFRTEQISLNKE